MDDGGVCRRRPVCRLLMLCLGWLLAGVVHAQASLAPSGPASAASAAASSVPGTVAPASPPAGHEVTACPWSSPQCLANAAATPMPWVMNLVALWLRAAPGWLGALLGLMMGLAGVYLVLVALEVWRRHEDPGPPGMPPPLPPPGQGFGFRRHWGGLGGESTGWSASPQLMQLVVGIGFLLLGMVVVVAVQPQGGGLPAAKADEPEAVASAAAKPASH